MFFIIYYDYKNDGQWVCYKKLMNTVGWWYYFASVSIRWVIDAIFMFILLKKKNLWFFSGSVLLLLEHKDTDSEEVV